MHEHGCHHVNGLLSRLPLRIRCHPELHSAEGEISGHPNEASPSPMFDRLPHHAEISQQEKACLQVFAYKTITFHIDPRPHCRNFTTSCTDWNLLRTHRSYFDMSEITHPTIKGSLSCGTVGSSLDLADTIDRWLVPRNIPHVARSSYDPQSQPGPPPREIEVPGRPHLRIQRPRRCPRSG